MSFLKFIIRSLLYYLKKNLLLSLGVAISTTVITGSLIVGDSVQYSLNKIVSDRLGNTSHVIRTDDRYFNASLAGKIGQDLEVSASPVLMTNGIAVARGGQMRINHLQVLGVDSSFDAIAGKDSFYNLLTPDQVIISENMAERLDVKTGDEILLRMKRTSLIPMNAPFVSDRDNTISVRLEVSNIAGREDLGFFNLENSQIAPFNAFVSLTALNQLMDLDNRANLILINSDPKKDASVFLDKVADQWSLKDASLEIEKLDEQNEFQITSERIFIDEAYTKHLKSLQGFRYPILTYFVNSLSSNNNQTPYSFVSTLPADRIGENEVIINSWLANDLGVSPGDSLTMSYYVVGPLRELEVKEAGFIIHSVVEMEGRYADENLMPHLPGLSDAGNCRDWETGIPIDLESIRDKDEDYWDTYKGTPKAFISLPRAVELWKNRFGTYTAFRYSTQETTREELKTSILNLIEPEDLGYKAEMLRNEAEAAAREGVDFSQLFAGLSFFLLVAGILLTVLLFLLNMEFRKEQIHTLSALGISRKHIFRSIFTEGFIVAIPGALLGLLIAVFYNQAIFKALNGVWQDIVRTEMMTVQINGLTLVKGFAISLFVSAFAILVPLNNYIKNILQRNKTKDSKKAKTNNRRIYAISSVIIGLTGIGLIIWQLMEGERENPTVFFIAGGSLLISGLGLFRLYISRLSGKSIPSLTAWQLSLKNTIRNPARSMTIVILFALATFLVISTGSNRKDLFVDASDPSSGTGGFMYYAESTVPVLQNLNNPDVRFENGFNEDFSFVQFKKAEGDDASCLNLNKIMNPAIIATDPSNLEGRFSFVSSTKHLKDEDPWSTLNKDLAGDLIPAIADETVIKWGMGKKVGDTLHYRNSMGESMELLLVGGIAPSIFQGKVIISKEYFLENYPRSSGSSIFLIEGDQADSTQIMQEINRGLRDYGIEITNTAQRLAQFNSVTNTYLSIFLVMGALGLLLGTIGLGIVLFKSILERMNEIAILRVVGYSRKFIRKIIDREYIFLLIFGIGIGFLTAIIATLPSLLSQNADISFTTLIILLLVLIVNGWIWTVLITNLALRNKNIYQALRNE